MPSSSRHSPSTKVSAAAAGAALLQASQAKAADAASEVVVALVGCGGRGAYLARRFLAAGNARLGWIADADKSRLAKGAAAFGGPKVRTTDDMRRVFDDKSVDAVIVATPDHWHAPAAILACRSGKHVYVEKPCSHNIREGRLLVEAARRNKCLVQHGTQVRSTQMMIEAVQKLREGVIGQVRCAKAWNIQRRGAIGKQKPSQPPDSLDYDLWVGPATMIPYQANRVHNGWHWWHHFGTGDMGNDGVHDIDYARWGLGVTTHPDQVTALGGKNFFDDDQEFPDTQHVVFQYSGDGKTGSQRMLIYEQRLWSTNYPYNVDSGVEFYGDKGKMFLSRRGKAEVWGARDKKAKLDISRQPQDADRHIANFLAAVRGQAKVNAEIEIGHLTTSLCHLGNIATRLGRALKFDPRNETFVDDDEAARLVTRKYRDHWGRPA